MNETTFGQLVVDGHLELSDGYRTKRSELGPSGVPVLRVADIKNGRGKLAARPDHVQEGYRSAFSRKASLPGDVVVTTKGTVGRTALMSDDDPEFVYSPQVCFFRLRTGAPLLPGYLFHWLSSAEFRRQAAAVKGQTDMADYINLVDLRAMRIVLPPLDRQQAVAERLQLLDRAVYANQQHARTADALLDAKYLNAATGGPVAPLSSLAQFVNGRAYTKDATGTGRMVVRIAEISNGPGLSTVYNQIDVPEQHLATAGDLLFAWSGSLVVQRWFRDDAIINQHIFKVIPEKGRETWLLYVAVRYALEYFRAVARDKATTMGHIQRHHLDLPVPDPLFNDEDLAVCGLLWRSALKAEQNALHLVQLRGALRDALFSQDLEATLLKGHVA